MNIFESIRKDHDTQRNLLKLLTATSGDTKERDLIFKKLKKELVTHADGEERYFYKPLISNDMMQQHARHGMAEHHEIDGLIEQLEDANYDSSAWLKIAKKLQEQVEHHLKDEEHTFFQLAGKVLTNKEKIDLGSKYRAYMKENL